MLQTFREHVTSKTVVGAAAIVCCILWGSAFPSIKIGYALLHVAANDTASQILFAGLRLTGTGILTILIASLFKRRVLLPHRASWGKIGLLALVQTVAQYVFFYIGLSHATAAKSSIINGSTPFLTIVSACFVFRQERFTRFKLIGSLLGVFGIVLINLNFADLTAGASFIGEGFILISSIACALSASMTKIYSEKENPVVLTGYQFILGGGAMTVAGALSGGRFVFSNIGAVLDLAYLSLLSVGAYSLWSVLLKYNPVSRVVIFSFTIPVFGVLLSALMLREANQAINPQSIASLILVCAGIILINKMEPDRPAKVAAPS